jgi:hypothetical protein
MSAISTVYTEGSHRLHLFQRDRLEVSDCRTEETRDKGEGFEIGGEGGLSGPISSAIPSMP